MHIIILLVIVVLVLKNLPRIFSYLIEVMGKTVMFLITVLLEIITLGRL